MKDKKPIRKVKIFKNNCSCKFCLHYNKKTKSCLLKECCCVEEKIKASVQVLKNVYKRKELEGWK